MFSGKTSLVKAISTTASTACFDKNPQVTQNLKTGQIYDSNSLSNVLPQSVERGITLDLGFSSFQCPLPDQVKHILKLTQCILPGLMQSKAKIEVIKIMNLARCNFRKVGALEIVNGREYIPYIFTSSVFQWFLCNQEYKCLF